MVTAWLRRVDPAFYHKEPRLLQTEAQIARYTEDEQAEVRFGVLSADRTLHAAMTIVAVATYAAAIGAGDLVSRRDWPTISAFAVIAVAGPRALPWWPRRDATATWRHALIGCALVAIPAAWTHVDLAVGLTALATGATLLVARGRARVALLVVAVAVLAGAGTAANRFAPLAVVVAVAASILAGRAVARVWRRRTQVVTWCACAIVVLVCAYTVACKAAAVTSRLLVEIVAIAVAYVGICVIAGRIRRAELIARPRGLLTIPQSIVPLLDRSHDHAVICFRRD